ncbi:glycosyltransferase family 4 protein [Actinomycetota bacterium]
MTTTLTAAADARPDAADAPVGRRVAYVTKSYPRFSETFIAREILAREAAGEEIVGIASLRRPRDGNFHSLISGIRATVTWLPEGTRSMALAWAAMAQVRTMLSARGRTVPEAALRALVEEEPDVAVQGMLLAQWALELDAEHLHSHFASVSGRTTRLAHLITGLPWTLTAHAKDIFHEDNDPDRLRDVLQDASTVVAVSDMTADHIRSVAPLARVVRVYNGLDLADAAAHTARAASRPDAGRPRIVSVGRLVEKKGLGDLVDAVATLLRDGHEVELHIAGDGPLRGALIAQVCERGIAAHVHFHGPMPQHEVMSLLATATAFAAPCVVASDGDRDGLPTVLLEAMSMGVPVVATPVAGIPEAVEHGVTGLLVGERDVAALSSALARIVTDDALAQRLSKAGRARIEERFDVADQARRLRDLTEGLAVATEAGR